MALYKLRSTSPAFSTSSNPPPPSSPISTAMSNAGPLNAPAAPISMEERLKQAYELMEKMNGENENLRNVVLNLNARINLYEREEALNMAPPPPSSPPPPNHH